MRATIIAIVLLVCSCAVSSRMNRVTIGMTRAEVFSAVGSPTSVSAIRNVEYLNYRLSETGDDWWYGRTAPYYVRLVDGRVESYGRVGDFDSTKAPERRVILDVNQGQQDR